MLSLEYPDNNKNMYLDRRPTSKTRLRTYLAIQTAVIGFCDINSMTGYL